jgi:hypothetical protein
VGQQRVLRYSNRELRQTQGRPGCGTGPSEEACWETRQSAGLGAQLIWAWVESSKVQERISGAVVSGVKAHVHAIPHICQNGRTIRRPRRTIVRQPVLKLFLRCHSDFSLRVVLGLCVWEALDVSGRGTAPARPALCLGVV